MTEQTRKPLDVGHHSFVQVARVRVERGEVTADRELIDSLPRLQRAAVRDEVLRFESDRLLGV